MLEGNGEKRYGRLLVATLGAAWIAFLVLLYVSSVPVMVYLAFGLTVAVTLGVLWAQHRSASFGKMRRLAQLSEEISPDSNAPLKALDETDIPDEIIPIVRAYNRLVCDIEDRFLREREFIADASHELRTPLAGIRLQTQIAMRASDAEQQAKAHQHILVAIERATRLVEQLLTLSRLTADGKAPNRETVDLQACCAGAIETLKRYADAKAIIIELVDDPPSLPAMVEISSIQCMLENLLLNAIQHSPREGRVCVSLEETTQGATLRIIDQGPGVTEEDRERVLRRFQKSATGQKAGTGLGLAIVQRVTELHGGNLVLGDGPDGRGLEVSVTLPLV